MYRIVSKTLIFDRKKGNLQGSINAKFWRLFDEPVDEI